MADRSVEAVVRAISVPCGRCSGTGKERHQLDRDPAAGYGEHACPNCHGDGRTVMHGTPEQIARRAIEVLGADRVLCPECGIADPSHSIECSQARR